MKANYTIEFFSSKVWMGFLKGFRVQYYWRARHRNGNIVAIGGEGYHNRVDRDRACYNFIGACLGETIEYKEL